MSILLADYFWDSLPDAELYLLPVGSQRCNLGPKVNVGVKM